MYGLFISENEELKPDENLDLSGGKYVRMVFIGSDSIENGKIEAAYFFEESEVVANKA